MLIVSHRGNLEGPNPSTENTPEAIKRAISEGFDVEVDVWFDGESLWLGHDCPQYKTDLDFIRNDRIWCHAKNMASMEKLHTEGVHHFWHESDKCTMTSRGIPWCFPEIYVKHGITVMEDFTLPPPYIRGVCTDYPIFFRNKNL